MGVGLALMAYSLVGFVVWPIVGMATLGLLWPFAQRQRDYFYINNHTFGGRYFETNFPIWRMYAIFGIAIGLAATLLASRLLSGLLYGVSPTDLVALSVTSLAVLVVALVATWIPARQAAALHPSDALRSQ